MLGIHRMIYRQKIKAAGIDWLSLTGHKLADEIKRKTNQSCVGTIPKFITAYDLVFT